MTEKMNDKMFNLSDPNFHESLGIYPKWRIGDRVSQSLSEIYPYYEADQCEEILDAVCGIDGWGCEYREVAGMLFCSIQIFTEKNIIEKSDAGGARASRKKNIIDVDKETYEAKTAATSAFVRASAKWGIGRHLNLLPRIYLKSIGNGKVETKSGDIISVNELSAWCNKVSPSIQHLMAIYRIDKNKFIDNDNKKLLSELKKIIEK